MHTNTIHTNMFLATYMQIQKIYQNIGISVYSTVLGMKVCDQGGKGVRGALTHLIQFHPLPPLEFKSSFLQTSKSSPHCEGTWDYSIILEV